MNFPHGKGCLIIGFAFSRALAGSKRRQGAAGKGEQAIMKASRKSRALRITYTVMLYTLSEMWSVPWPYCSRPRDTLVRTVKSTYPLLTENHFGMETQ